MLLKVSSYPLIGQNVLWLVIMSSDWSAFPLIGQNILLLVSISSDWSQCSLIDKKLPSDCWSICPPIGYHALWLVIMSSCYMIWQVECSSVTNQNKQQTDRQTDRQTCAILQMLTHLNIDTYLWAKPELTYLMSHISERDYQYLIVACIVHNYHKLSEGTEEAGSIGWHCIVIIF